MEYKIKIEDINENYQSPVELITKEWEQKLFEEEENYIMTQISQQMGVKVDRDELLKALEYDRGQFDKGYKCGYAKRDEKIIRCKDCKYREEYKIFGRPTAYYCLRGCVDSNLSLDENDYCCWGERKETDE